MKNFRTFTIALFAVLSFAVYAHALTAYIDAQSGIIVGRGESNTGSGTDYSAAKQRAVDKAREGVMNILLRQPVDPDSMEQRTIGEYLRDYPEREYMLKSFVDSAKIFKEAQKDGNVEVTIILPVEGPDGYKIMIARLMGKVIAAKNPVTISSGVDSEMNSLAGRSASELREPYRIAVTGVLNDKNFISSELGNVYGRRLFSRFIRDRRFDVYPEADAADILSESGTSERQLWTSDPSETINIDGLDGVVLISIEKYEPVVKKRGIGGTGYLETTIDVELEVRILNSRTGKWVFFNTVTSTISDKVFTLKSADDAENVLKINDIQDTTGLAYRAIEQSVMDVESIIRSSFPLEGYVLKVISDRIYVNLARADGIEVGDVMELYRTGEMLTDPVTGEDIDYIRERLGSVRVTEVRDTYSQAAMVEIPTGPVNPGDIVSMKY